MKEKQKPNMRDFFMPEDLISSYSRKQAIDDGLLVDVTEVARQMGILYPVALSRAVFDDSVSWSAKDDAKAFWPQDESGRLHDLVWLLYLAMRGAKPGEARVSFDLNRVPRPGKGKKRKVSLRAEVHGGDNGEPVVTVMLPNED